MITVLEESVTGLQRDGRNLYRRVYLVPGKDVRLPTDGAPGSLALVRAGDEVELHILFPDGVWGRV